MQCVSGDQEVDHFGLKEAPQGNRKEITVVEMGCNYEFCLEPDRTEGIKISGFPEGEFSVRGY